MFSVCLSSRSFNEYKIWARDQRSTGEKRTVCIFERRKKIHRRATPSIIPINKKWESHAVSSGSLPRNTLTQFTRDWFYGMRKSRWPWPRDRCWIECGDTHHTESGTTGEKADRRPWRWRRGWRTGWQGGRKQESVKQNQVTSPVKKSGHHASHHKTSRKKFFMDYTHFEEIPINPQPVSIVITIK